MAAHPRNGNTVVGQQGVKLPPKVFVLNRLELFSLFSLPTIRLPFRHPLVDSLSDILAIGNQLDITRRLERAKPFDNGGQFHAVVGRFAYPAAALLLFAGVHMPQDIAPATRPRVATTAAVGKKLNERSRHKKMVEKNGGWWMAEGGWKKQIAMVVIHFF